MPKTSTILQFDLCVIGAGSGGLSLAAGAVQFGLKTCLIEADKMGGDCLNSGCVPSKSLLAAAKRAQLMQDNSIDGVSALGKPKIDYAKIKDHIAAIIATLAPHDSIERFEGLGVNVIQGHAGFLSPHLVQVGEVQIAARYFAIATGSSPLIPAITGLDPQKILTNRTIFNYRTLPKHLLIIGGGPIGIEMALAHHHLGSKVTILDNGKIMPKDDQEHVTMLREYLETLGITILESIQIKQVQHQQNKIIIMLEQNGLEQAIEGTELLVAAGRKAKTEGLGLELAKVNYDIKGIDVDQRLRTNQHHIFALGDVSKNPQFTHVAGYHAGIILRNICFKIPAKLDYRGLSWVTYGDYELAQAGLTHDQAIARFGKDQIRLTSLPFTKNDRAVIDGISKGQIKVITNKKGLILGASIFGANAGELISLWSLAIQNKMKIGAITSMIAPYPSLGEINKRVAGEWFTPKLFSPKIRNLVAFIQKIPFI